MREILWVDRFWVINFVFEKDNLFFWIGDFQWINDEFNISKLFWGSQTIFNNETIEEGKDMIWFISVWIISKELFHECVFLDIRVY